MCEPREKSQRVRGREREAGCEEMRGTSKRERVAMPPLARRAVEMLKSSRARVEDTIVGGGERGRFVRYVWARRRRAPIGSGKVRFICTSEFSRI